MESSLDIPILFLIFNRPDLTQSVFNRIRELRPKHLYVAADGFRPGKPGEALHCQEARQVTEQIDWDCSVHRLYRSENLGCKNAVSSAITWFFEQVEMGIILEDDCLPNSSFFAFAEQMLHKYATDERVAVISAGNFQKGCERGNASYYFSRYAHIWGWATWRRVWRQYDVNLTEWPSTRRKIADWVITKGTANFFAARYDDTKSGKLDTWDYQLTHALFSHRQLTIIPKTNLVENLGFDERATHTAGGDNPAKGPPQGVFTFPLVHPGEVVANDAADRFTECEFYGGKAPLLHRLLRKIKRSIF